MNALTHPNHELIALGIRQPWAELILRGIKTIEVRTVPTAVRGTIYLYAGRKVASSPAALSAARRFRLEIPTLPTGLIVGTVDIVDCCLCLPDHADAACVPPSALEGMYGWHLANGVRLDKPLRNRFRPYGIWFYPFKRCSGDTR